MYFFQFNEKSLCNAMDFTVIVRSSSMSCPHINSTVYVSANLESPLDSKEIKPVHPKGNQPWIFTGRTDAEASILWPPDAKSWLIWKDPDAGKDWRHGRRGRQMRRWLDGITDSMDMNLSQVWKTVKDREIWHAAVHGVTKSRTWLSDWTTTTMKRNGKKNRATRQTPLDRLFPEGGGGFLLFSH